MRNVYFIAKLILMLKKDNLNWIISQQRGTSSIKDGTVTYTPTHHISMASTVTHMKLHVIDDNDN